MTGNGSGWFPIAVSRPGDKGWTLGFMLLLIVVRIMNDS
jgi:hypothetical protein